jgi:hypothetical protein
MLKERVIKVLSTKMGIASSCLDGEHTTSDI